MLSLVLLLPGLLLLLLHLPIVAASAGWQYARCTPLAAALVLLDVEILLVFCLIAVLCKSYSVLHPMWLLTLLEQQVLT